VLAHAFNPLWWGPSPQEAQRGLAKLCQVVCYLVLVDKEQTEVKYKKEVINETTPSKTR